MLALPKSQVLLTAIGGQVDLPLALREPLLTFIRRLPMAVGTRDPVNEQGVGLVVVLQR
jgi:hypothetical protein